MTHPTKLRELVLNMRSHYETGQIIDAAAEHGYTIDKTQVWGIAAAARVKGDPRAKVRNNYVRGEAA